MSMASRIALYGYGRCGRLTAESLKRYWGGAYTVTAVFDRDPAGQTDPYWDLPVLPADRLEDEYRRGTFEAVMLTVNDREARIAVGKYLQERRIPQFYPGSEEDFAEPEDFEQEEDPAVTVDRPGYRFRVYRNMLGAVSDCMRRNMFFLFNEEGRVNIDSYRKYRDDLLPYLLTYPFRLRDPLPERVFLEGDWCPIVKTYTVNFYHFTFETADCVYLMEKAGYRGKYLYSKRGFTDEMLKILGVSKDRLVSTEELEEHKVYVFERLYDINCMLPEMTYGLDVLPEMGRYFQSLLERDETFPRKLYVKRIGIRKLLNGEEIARRNGFAVMVPEEHPMLEQMKYFYNADIVLTPHGANCTHYLCMRKGTAFIETFSDHWDIDMNWGVCSACGVRYRRVTGRAQGAVREKDNISDYFVDETALQELIDEAERYVEERKKRGLPAGGGNGSGQDG